MNYAGSVYSLRIHIFFHISKWQALSIRMSDNPLTLQVSQDRFSLVIVMVLHIWLKG